MVQLATELLSEQIRPVQIVSISDQGGEPQGEFISNQQRFVFRFTRSGMITYRPKTMGGNDPERTDGVQARLDRFKANRRASR
jgi:hypothetical protein